jgi:hypothetical protein
MWLFNALIQWFQGLFEGLFAYSSKERKQSGKSLPSIHFQKINLVEKPPRNGEVQKNMLYLVAPNNRHKWVLFQCPCGCQSVITLSLQGAHNPHWTLAKSRADRPILSPSVWRDTGCLSHFLVNDGRIFWCATGKAPKK